MAQQLRDLRLVELVFAVQRAHHPQAISRSDSPLAALHKGSRTFAPAASSVWTSTRNLGQDNACAARTRFAPSTSGRAAAAAPVR